MSSIEIITASEKRRYWTRDEKRRLVAALEDPAANVSEVARAAGVSTSLLYRRRRQQLAAPPERPKFIPVAIASAEAPATTGLSQAAITIAFGANVRVTIEGAPDAQTLSTVIGALNAPERRG